MRITSRKRRKRSRTHGFLVRMRTAGGRAALKKRRRKGRYQIVVRVRKKT